MAVARLRTFAEQQSLEIEQWILERDLALEQADLQVERAPFSQRLRHHSSQHFQALRRDAQLRRQTTRALQMIRHRRRIGRCRVRQLVIAPPLLQRQQQQLKVGGLRQSRRFLFEFGAGGRDGHSRLRHLALAEHLIEPATRALLLRRETRRGHAPRAIGISHHRSPAGRVAGDAAALVYDEPQRVALLHVERQLGLHALVVLALDLGLPHFAFVVTDTRADAIAVEVQLEHAARDHHAPSLTIKPPPLAPLPTLHVTASHQDFFAHSRPHCRLSDPWRTSPSSARASGGGPCQDKPLPSHDLAACHEHQGHGRGARPPSRGPDMGARSYTELLLDRDTARSL